MVFVRLLYSNQARYGVLEGQEIQLIEGTPWQKYSPARERIGIERAKLLAPCQPSKVVCVGLNYADHVQEFGDRPLPKEPVLFLKPSSSVIGPGAPIVYPAISRQVDHEAELAVVIKEETRLVSVKEAGRRILGYTCGNDVTARDLQRKDGQWTRGKSFDTFCPLGPCIVDHLEPEGAVIQLLVNNEMRQNSHTSHMIFPVEYLVSFISQVMTLFPGDVIMTGTPAGVGQIIPGDTVTVRIPGVGELTNTVINGV
ncbi:MAG: fumarylacetoacetate hydrolase family protein [Firmicutes bacterium]|nr:fumarylacetoacetate hydrolase family protein [Bacillota bacterium]